ncbi:MAG: prepilin-type N-terminal cleavage/methylation domain-containing protein [Myxococcales bacterium]
MQQRRAKDRGFTLLEMVTVLGILGVMTGLAIVSMNPLREQATVRQGAEQLQQLLQLARKKALGSSRCYRVELLDVHGEAVPAGAPAIAVRLRRYLRPGCHFPDPPGSPQPTTADFEGSDTFGLPHGTTATLVDPPQVLDVLPTGRPKLSAGLSQVRFEVRHQQEVYWVDLMPSGAVCQYSASAPRDCP